MANLLLASLSESDIRSILNAKPLVSLLLPVGSQFWVQSAANPALATAMAPIRAAAFAEADQPMPQLTDALYAEFAISGNRTRFETPYFERRRRLGRVSAAILMGADDPSLVRSLIEKAQAILAEESWSVPAHVHLSSGKDRGWIDLFASETANQMAELVTMFEALLPAGLVSDIRERISETVLRPFIDQHDRWFWAKNSNNWNAVCHQGVVGAALTIERDLDLLARILALASEGLPYFLEGFGVDGGTSEGPGYWGYGFGWFARLNQQLEAATSGALSLFEGDPRIPTIALFGIRMTLAGNHFVNFADGPASGSLDPTLLEYLGRRLGSEEMRLRAARGYREILSRGANQSELRADVSHYARLIAGWPTVIETREPADLGDFYFRDLDVLISRHRDSRGRLWELAAKGGHNAESHNHNDCGSYIVQIDGVPLVTEIGAPEYTRQFFGPERYTNLAARSLGHSVPLVGAVEQADGRMFEAKVLERRINAEGALLRLDLAACYPESAGCEKLIRTIEHRAEGFVGVRDEYALSERAEGRIETAIVTHAPVERVEPGFVTIAGNGIRLRVTPEPGTSVRSIDTYGYNTHGGGTASISRIALAATGNSRAGVLGYTLTAE